MKPVAILKQQTPKKKQRCNAARDGLAIWQELFVMSHRSYTSAALGVVLRIA